MHVHIFDKTTLSPAATVTNILGGTCSARHNESGRASITVPAGNHELTPLVSVDGVFSVERLTRSPMLWTAHVRDWQGRLVMQGRVTINPGQDGGYELAISDLLDELRLISLPPQTFLNGLFFDVIDSILAYMPPADRRSDTIIRGERWRVRRSEAAINSWTSQEAGRMSCLEAIISACDATGNNFRLSDDGSRTLVFYSEPEASMPALNIVQGGLHARQPANGTVTLIEAPAMSVENDAIIAGVIPEGGGYTTPQNITKVLRLKGDEYIPHGYRMANLNGFWGVFNQTLVSDPINSGLPDGQIRCEAFGSITPMVNAYESVSAVAAKVSDSVVYSPVFSGYPPNHWLNAEVTYGESETVVVASGGDSITMRDRLPITAGDVISVSVFREWKPEIIQDAQQSLAGASVALLDANQKVVISWRVRIPNREIAVMLGDRVRLLYSGGVSVRGRQDDVVRFIPSVSLSDVYIVSEVELTQDDTGLEYLVLTLTERLWRFPSGSGLREIMALIQRRLPGVRMGREGAAFVE